MFGTPNFLGNGFDFLVEKRERQLGASEQMSVGFVGIDGITPFGFVALLRDGATLFGEFEPFFGELSAGFALKVGERGGQTVVVDDKGESGRSGLGELMLL